MMRGSTSSVLIYLYFGRTEVCTGHYMTLNAIVCRENTVGIALYAPEADLYKISKSSMYFLHNSIDGNVTDE